MGGPSAGEDERCYKIQTVSQSREGAQGTSAIVRLRLSHTTLSALVSRDPFCPWWQRAGSVLQYVESGSIEALKQEMFHGLRGSPTPRAEGVRRQT
ncbi:hypothetical protein E2C01_094806 [Portunus trituberculatus]|uniref:Uncharacterized protein n=1 Tax=Portunus trituberculatus TaxID=210409 RepID=A0A5B7JTG3_PORTR|nr:hypothetical protein [Portunus trituberculatus]